MAGTSRLPPGRGLLRYYGIRSKRHIDKESGIRRRRSKMLTIDSTTGPPVPGPVLARDGDRFAAWLADLTWAKLYPEGRDLYYEGNHPEKFAEAIREEFGFDPSADQLWGKRTERDDGGPGFTLYGFHCPAQHIDAIYSTYASRRFPGQVRVLHEARH
jgi:hypothetical protein